MTTDQQLMRTLHREGAGWQGTGNPMTVGVGYAAESTAMARRCRRRDTWLVSARRYPQSVSWKAVVACFSNFCQRRCTTQCCSRSWRWVE